MIGIMLNLCKDSVNIIVIKLWKDFYPHYVSRLLFHVESCLTQQLPTCDIEIGGKLWTCVTRKVLYHSETFLVKQGTFLQELWPDSVEKRDTFNTEFWHKKEFDIEDLFSGKLFITDKYRILNFSDSETFVDGRKRRRE